MYRLIYCCGCRKYVETKLVKGSEVYPHRKDLYGLNFYRCSCGLSVGCHKRYAKKTALPRPFGCIATKEVKNARRHIHNLLDPLWKEKKVKRTEIYGYISRRIGFEYHTAEIRTVKRGKIIYKIIQDFINKRKENV